MVIEIKLIEVKNIEIIIINNDSFKTEGYVINTESHKVFQDNKEVVDKEILKEIEEAVSYYNNRGNVAIKELQALIYNG